MHITISLVIIHGWYIVLAKNGESKGPIVGSKGLRYQDGSLIFVSQQKFNGWFMRAKLLCDDGILLLICVILLYNWRGTQLPQVQQLSSSKLYLNLSNGYLLNGDWTTPSTISTCVLRFYDMAIMALVYAKFFSFLCAIWSSKTHFMLFILNGSSSRWQLLEG